MSLRSSTKNYLNFYYILGISPYQPSPKSPFLYLFKYAGLVQAIFGYIIATVCYLNLWSDESNVASTASESFILTIYVGCEYTRVTSVFIQYVWFASTLTDTMHIFHELDIYFVRHLNHRINYRKFVNKFHLRMMLTVGVMILCIVFFFLRLKYSNFIITQMNVYIKPLQLITVFCYTHVIFHVDLLNFHFAELLAVMDRHIAQRAIQNCTVGDVKRQLKSYKVIHFRLYYATKGVNIFFGYSLLSLVSHAFANFVYFAYWVFDTLHADRGLFTLWS